MCFTNTHPQVVEKHCNCKWVSPQHINCLLFELFFLSKIYVAKHIFVIQSSNKMIGLQCIKQHISLILVFFCVFLKLWLQTESINVEKDLFKCLPKKRNHRNLWQSTYTIWPMETGHLRF